MKIKEIRNIFIFSLLFFQLSEFNKVTVILFLNLKMLYLSILNYFSIHIDSFKFIYFKLRDVICSDNIHLKKYVCSCSISVYLLWPFRLNHWALFVCSAWKTNSNGVKQQIIMSQYLEKTPILESGVNRSPEDHFFRIFHLKIGF